MKTDTGMRYAHGMHETSKRHRRRCRRRRKSKSKSKSKHEQEYQHGLPAVLGCKG